MPSDPISAPDLAGGITHPVAAPLTRAAIFLVATLNPGPTIARPCGRSAETSPRWCAQWNFATLKAGLSCVMGFGSDAWDRLFGPPRPADAASVPGDSRRSAPRGLHAGRLAVPHPREAHGFVLRAGDANHGAYRRCRFAGRRGARIPLLRRPRSHRLRRRNGESAGARQRSTPCSIGDEDAAFAGGSYVIVQKYLHDLDGWNALSTEAQERIIGRTKLSDIELDDSIKPTSAHNALTTIVEDGKEIKILRDNMPFGRAGHGEFGTYFIGYSRSPRTIEQMLENMFIGRPPGNYDRLLDFSRAVTGNLFFVPSATFLETVAEDQPAVAAPSAAPAPVERASIQPFGERWFARYRFPQRRHPP